MNFPLYLAMTDQEMAGSSGFPRHMGYLGCCFSRSGPGISGLPRSLPAGCMLILDDRNPFENHDPRRIADTLDAFIRQWDCAGLLLDFQRPGCPETGGLARLLGESLPCPVAVSHCYAESVPGPVFLPPVPPDCPVAEHLAPWTGREIWLEMSFSPLCLTLTESGCTRDTHWISPEEEGFPCAHLFCRCRTEVTPDAARFYFRRSREDLYDLMGEAQNFGVTRAIGLWQELG